MESNKLSILDWMDDIVKDYEEYEALAEAEDPQFEKLYEILRKWNKNVYPKQADEDGIALFEQLLNITPIPNEDLEDRRYRVIAKLNAKLPYTEVQLRRILGGILGYDGYTLTIKDLILTLSLAENNNNKIQIIYELLKEIVPMNIFLVLHQFVQKRVGTYTGGYVKIGNTVKISPYSVDSIEETSDIYLGGYIKIGIRIRINP